MLKKCLKLSSDGTASLPLNTLLQNTVYATGSDGLVILHDLHVQMGQIALMGQIILVTKIFQLIVYS